MLQVADACERICECGSQLAVSQFFAADADGECQAGLTRLRRDLVGITGKHRFSLLPYPDFTNFCVEQIVCCTEEVRRLPTTDSVSAAAAVIQPAAAGFQYLCIMVSLRPVLASASISRADL